MFIYEFKDDVRRRIDNGEFTCIKLSESRRQKGKFNLTFATKDGLRLNLSVRNPVVYLNGNEVEEVPVLKDARLDYVQVCSVWEPTFKKAKSGTTFNVRYLGFTVNGVSYNMEGARF